MDKLMWRIRVLLIVLAGAICAQAAEVTTRDEAVKAACAQLGGTNLHTIAATRVKLDPAEVPFLGQILEGKECWRIVIALHGADDVAEISGLVPKLARLEVLLTCKSGVVLKVSSTTLPGRPEAGGQQIDHGVVLPVRRAFPSVTDQEGEMVKSHEAFLGVPGNAPGATLLVALQNLNPSDQLRHAHKLTAYHVIHHCPVYQSLPVWALFVQGGPVVDSSHVSIQQLSGRKILWDDDLLARHVVDAVSGKWYFSGYN